jgi:predicted PurR-regulated permease PerM
MEKSSTNNQELSFAKRIWIIGGIFALIIVILLLFKTLFSLLLLIFAGTIIAAYFYGVAGVFERKFHWSPKLSIALSVILNIVLLVAFFWFVGARIQQQVAQLTETLPATIQKAKDQISQSPVGNKLLQQLSSSGDSKKSLAAVKSFFSSSFGALSDLYIVILLAAFFTASPSLYKKGLVKLFPTKAKDKGSDLIEKISSLLKKWVKGQIIGLLFISVVTAIGLLILGMPLVLTLALIAGIMNFIPNFGPIIALIPAVLIALTQGSTTALIVFVMYTGIQIFQSAVTQPLVQKKMISIPPALTVIGQVAMGTLGGFWGVLLAQPFVAMLMVLVEELYVDKQSAEKDK